MFSYLNITTRHTRKHGMGSWDGLVGWAHGMGSWAPIMMGSWDGLMGWGRGMGLWAVNLMGSWDGLMGSKFNGLRIKSELNVKKNITEVVITKIFGSTFYFLVHDICIQGI